MNSTLSRAAQLLEYDADCLRSSHTLNGEWVIEDVCDETAKADHDERLAVAAKLRLMAAV